MRHVSLLAVCSLLAFAGTAAPAGAAPADPAAIRSAQTALLAAAARGTASDLLQARGRLAALSAANPGSAELHYWTALADWRLAPRLVATDRAAERWCRDGLEHAARAVELDPKHAEALALRSSLLGLSLTFDPGAMMTVGPEVEEIMARAVAMAPKNPRVVLLDGIGTLGKPGFVGGGARPALARLTAAAALFDAEAAADSPVTAWGRDDACVWAGRAAFQLGDPAGAVVWYRRALAASPGHAWVVRSLLPEAEKAAADSAAAGASR
jgi:tetratricopeptide (TPR) repeat protein